MKQFRSFRFVGCVSGRKRETHCNPVGRDNYVDFCGKPAARASNCLFSLFFKASQASGCTLTAVESIESTSTSMSIMPSARNASKILSRTPFLLHLFIRTYIVCQLPYSFGSALHLHPFSTTYNIALRNRRLSILTFPRCFGKYSFIPLYCSGVICMILFYHFFLCLS